MKNKKKIIWKKGAQNSNDHIPNKKLIKFNQGIFRESSSALKKKLAKHKKICLCFKFFFISWVFLFFIGPDSIQVTVTYQKAWVLSPDLPSIQQHKWWHDNLRGEPTIIKGAGFLVAYFKPPYGHGHGLLAAGGGGQVVEFRFVSWLHRQTVQAGQDSTPSSHPTAPQPMTTSHGATSGASTRRATAQRSSLWGSGTRSMPGRQRAVRGGAGS